MRKASSKRKRARNEKPVWDAVFPESLGSGRERMTECGACLLDIEDDDQTPSGSDIASADLREDETEHHSEALLGLLSGCRHAFHASCIQTWAARDSFCPQCKQQFEAIGFYTKNGLRVSFKEYPLVFFGDTLTDGEYDATDDEPEEPASEEPRRRRATRPRRSARITGGDQSSRPPRPRRHGVSAETQPPARELSPERLAQHRLRVQMRRAIERERRERLCARVTAAQARATIEQSLSRLPYEPTVVGPLVPREDETAPSSSLAATGATPEDMTSSDNRKQPSTVGPRSSTVVGLRPTSVIPRPRVPVTLTVAPRAANGSELRTPFQGFCTAPPRYRKDFLLS